MFARKFLSAILIVLTLVLPASGNPSPCIAYKELSAKLGCSSEGYLEHFGYEYCEKFLRTEKYFSAETQLILQKIRPCLISELQQTSALTCENVQKVSEAAHVKCYLENGFCNISRRDQIGMAMLVLKELFIQPSLRMTMNVIRETCRRQF